MAIAARKPLTRAGGAIVYPESDNKPIADNTLQFEWIATLKGGLDALFADDPNVFVAGDLLWYPVEGDNKTRIAPDALVAFGRPKGHRGSYLQWQEDDIAPQVVFEVLSPGNRAGEMSRKLAFYDRYDVEEYYAYDPYSGNLSGWRRAAPDDALRTIAPMNGHISPRLGIRFDTSGREMVVYRPDGQRFLTYVELSEARERAEHEREQARERAERLAARLRELGIDPDAL